MVKRLSFEEFKAIYSKVPRLTIDLVIKNENSEVLLTLRDIEPWKNMWHLPGGTVLLGETAEDTAKRVALDETGLEIELENLLDVVYFFHEAEGYKEAVSLAYSVKVTGGSLKINEQASRVSYFKTLPENTVSEHKQFLTTQGLAN